MLEKPGITYTKEQAKKDINSCIIEFFGESDEILTVLQDRIDSCKGHVRFFMHPLELDSSQPVSSGHYSQVDEALKKTLNQNNKSALTIIALPERSFESDKKEIVFRFGKSAEELGILFIKTEGDKGILAFSYWNIFKKYKKLFRIPDKFLDDRLFSPDMKASMCFLSLSLLLESFGIKSMTCYGGFLGKFYNNWKEKEEVSRCLGDFIRFMKGYSKIDLDISNNVVYKDGLKREDLKKFGVPLKETGKVGEKYRRQKQ